MVLILARSFLIKAGARKGKTENQNTTFWNIETVYTRGSSSLGAGYSTSLSDSESAGLQKIEEYDYQYAIDKYSVTLGVRKRKKINLYFNTGVSFKVLINPYYSEEKYLKTDRRDKITGVTAYLSMKLSKKINSSLSSLWEKQKFTPENERVKRYSIGSSLNYILNRHITASAGYTFNSNNSNIDFNDFHNNVGWIQAKLYF